MILTSHQPNFVPYMGMFYKIYKSDIFVVSEDVMYSKQGMHNWNKIYTKDGVKKITIPVHAHHDTRLVDIKICNPEHSIETICKTIEQEYQKASHKKEGQELIEFIRSLIDKEVYLVDFNLSIIKFILKKMNISVEILRSTKDLDIKGHKDERIFLMCEQTGADVYYSGKGAIVYHQPEEYKKRNIDLVYSDYEPTKYEQCYEPYETNLSVIDYVFNNGYEIPKEWKNGK